MVYSRAEEDPALVVVAVQAACGVRTRRCPRLRLQRRLALGLVCQLSAAPIPSLFSLVLTPLSPDNNCSAITAQGGDKDGLYGERGCCIRYAKAWPTSYSNRMRVRLEIYEDMSDIHLPPAHLSIRWTCRRRRRGSSTTGIICKQQRRGWPLCRGSYRTSLHL